MACPRMGGGSILGLAGVRPSPGPGAGRAGERVLPLSPPRKGAAGYTPKAERDGEGSRTFSSLFSQGSSFPEQIYP